MTPKLFSELGLSPEVLKAIEKLGFEQAAPIQAESIPVLMTGRDVVGQSQTGSGKTAAFAVPAIEKVDATQRTTQVLILCPTRELAIQVCEEVHKLSLFKRGLHALPVYGGQSYDRQLAGLRQGAHIVIGTPGRIMDHMRRGTLKLATIKMVILDEVDVMLNMGFRDDIELILQSTPKERQTVFFSATIPRPIEQLIQKYSRDPQKIRIEQKALTVPTVEQVYYEVDRRYKVDLLTRLIDMHDLKLGIIFCNTKRMVDDLVDHLNTQGYSADRLHGDMTQMMRDRVMQKFRRSGIEFLVATDVAARGLDVDHVEVVFNYDLPYDGEDYVHRIGRTGRQGRSGRAISFASGREVFQIRNIERYINMRIQRGHPPTEQEVEGARQLVFLDKLRATLKSGEFERYDQVVERLLEEGFASTDIASALIHQLHRGEPAAAKPPPRAEEKPRFERPPRFSERPAAPAPSRPAERPKHVTSAPAVERPKHPPSAPAVEHPIPAPAAIAPSPSPAPSPAPAPVPTPSLPPAASRAVEWKHPLPKLPPKPAPVKPQPKPAPVAAKPEPAAAKPAAAPAPKPAAMPSSMSPVPIPPAPAIKKSAKSEESKPYVKKERVSAPSFQRRLWMNVGEQMGVTGEDVTQLISGETGLPPEVISKVDVRERHLFIDVADEHANAIISKLNRTQIKGHKIKVKTA